MIFTNRKIKYEKTHIERIYKQRKIPTEKNTKGENMGMMIYTQYWNLY